MEPMIRGYSVKQQFHFLETQYEPAVSQRLLAQIPEEVRLALADLHPADWYPRSYSVAALRAIASHRGDDERAVYDDMVRCGTFIATEATNTFLRILMKVLTPALFAKKIPDFWRRDQTSGHFEVDISGTKDRRFQLKLCDVAGFDHVGLLGIGWMTHGLTMMGKQDVVVTQHGWSLSAPGPQEISYEVSWS